MFPILQEQGFLAKIKYGLSLWSTYPSHSAEINVSGLSLWSTKLKKAR